MKNLQRGFVVPLIIATIVILAIGGGLYFYNVTKVKSTDWKKYSESELLAMVKSQSWYDEATYFIALENNFLILDQGTAPDPRGLIVYDLNINKKIYSDRYSKPIEVKNNTITYWSPIDTKVTKENCPESIEWAKNWLGAGMESHIILNLSDLSKKESGEYRCSVRQ